jgi:hypothetical protein
MLIAVFIEASSLADQPLLDHAKQMAGETRSTQQSERQCYLTFAQMLRRGWCDSRSAR